MKKFNWKLLLVVALALVLVISLFACDPKNDDNTPNTPVTPDVEPEIEYLEPERGDAQDVFFTELYNVANGIGNEKVPADKNVYLDLDLGLALGTRATTGEKAKAESKFALGIALKAILDRQTGEGSQLSLGLTAGQATIANIYFTQQDHMAYVRIGDQKVKINTELVDLGGMLKNMLEDEMVIKSSSKADDGTKTQIERYYYSLDELLTQLTGEMGHAWTIDNLLGVVFKHFRLADGVTDMIKGIKVAGLDVNSIFFDEEGDLSLKHALTAAPFQGLFVAQNSGTHYEAKLGSVLTGVLEPMIGAGAGVGKLDVKVSFDAEDHKLVAGKGVKISADFDVDEKNTVYTKSNGNPFVEVSINSLKVKEANAQTIAPADVAEYKEDLQLDIKEEIEIKGFKIGGAETGSRLPRHIELRLLANLDLVNTENNKTKLHLYLDQLVQETNQKVLSSEFSMEDFKTHTEYATLEESIEHVFDFTYANGRLTHTFNGDADIVPGYFAWAGVLHDPLANLISGALKAADPALAETFLERYNHQSGGGVAGARYDFKGMYIDNLDINAVIGLIGGMFGGSSASTAAEPQETPAGPTETEEGANMYNAILKVFTLLNTTGDGKFGIKLHGLLDEGLELLKYFGLTSIGSGEDATPLTKEALFPFLKDAVEGFMSMLTSDGLLDLDGCTPDKNSDVNTFIQKLDFLFAGTEPDEGQITFDFDLSNGLYWQLYWLAQDNEEKEAVYQDVNDSMNVEKNKLIDRGTEDVSIRYKSMIKINETPVEVSTDPFTDMFEKKALYEEGIEAAQATLDAAKAAAEPKNTAYETAKAAYEATDKYKAYVQAQADYTAAKQATSDLINEYKTVPGVSSANASGYYGQSLGKNVSTIYSQNSSSNTSKPLYLWVKNGKKTDDSDENYKKITDFIEAATKAVDTYKTQLGDSYESWKKAWDMEGEDNLWTAYLAECEALIAQNDTKAAAETNDLPEYKAYKDAQSEKNTADKAVSDAQKAVDALEDPYFYYFYLDLKTL